MFDGYFVPCLTFKIFNMRATIIFLAAFIAINLNAGKTPSLKDAIMGQNYDKVKEALDNGADPNEMISSSPAIYWASWTGRADVIKLLLEKGANVDGVGLIGITALGGIVHDPKTPEDYVKENNEINAKVLKRFTEEKAKASGWLRETDITKFSTPEQRCKILLDAGADPNFLEGNGTVKEWTPFLNALNKENISLVKVMLESKRVDLEFRFHQWSEGVVKFVNYINASGNQGTGFFNQRDWDKKDRQEWALLPKFDTPLLFAVEKNNLELVKILVEAGASLYNGKKTEKIMTSGKLYQYKSPLDIAVEKNYTEIADYLVSKGGIRYQED